MIAPTSNQAFSPTPLEPKIQPQGTKAKGMPPVGRPSYIRAGTIPAKVKKSCEMRSDGLPFRTKPSDGRRKRWIQGARTVMMAPRDLDSMKAKLTCSEMWPIGVTPRERDLFEERIEGFLRALFVAPSSPISAGPSRVRVTKEEFLRLRRRWQPHLWLTSSLRRGPERKLVAERVRDLFKRLFIVSSTPADSESNQTKPHEQR